jgi:hypothetical protein
MSISLKDDCCRSVTARKIDEYVRDNGQTPASRIAIDLKRSVRYILSVADECSELLVDRKTPAGQSVIYPQCLTCGKWLDGVDDGSDQCENCL